MLTLNSLINRVKNRLPNPVFVAIQQAEPDFFKDILYDETLTTFSGYYKKLVRGIQVRQCMMLPTTDSEGRKSHTVKYIIPLIEKDKPYLQIANFMHPHNYIGSGIYSGVSPGLVDSMVAKVTSSINMVNIRYVAEFEAPNIITISPPPRVHIDFTVNMYQMLGLDEIRLGYEEMFRELYEADCKLALYYKFYNVSDGGSYGGVEIKDYVGDFKDYESVRTDIIDKMEKDWYKDPTVFAEFLGSQEGHF